MTMIELLSGNPFTIGSSKLYICDEMDVMTGLRERPI